MEYSLLMFVAIFVGTVIQVTAGFSGGTIGTLILSMVLPLLQSSTLSTIAVVVTCISMTIEYHKYIQWSLVLPIIPIYALAFYLSLKIAVQIDTTMLKAWFGVALVVLSVYSSILSDKIRLQKGWITSTVCAGLSGVVSAFFGMGGPPVALYMLVVCEDNKKSYLANCQFIFAINSITGTIMRVNSGLLTKELTLLLIPGFLGLFMGRYIGKRIVEKLDMPKLHRAVSIVMAGSGLATFITNINW